MPAMEISIKWNVCRICLSEEYHRASGDAGSVDLGTESSCSSNASAITGRTKHVTIDNKMSQQIFECSGIKVAPDDSLPDKICGKCSTLLRYAIHFVNTCRNSNEYLQSVIRKTKSATSMLKLDKRREHVSELMDEIFNDESRLLTTSLETPINLCDEQAFVTSSAEVTQGNGHEVIGDSAREKRRASTQIVKMLQSAPKIFKVEPMTNECVDTMELLDDGRHEAEAMQSQIKTERHVTITEKEDFLTGKSSGDELIEQLTEEPDEYEDNDIEELEESDCKKDKLAKTTSECSMEDDGYIEDGDEEHIDALDIADEQNDYDAVEKKGVVDDEADADGVTVAEEDENSIGFKKTIKLEDNTIQEMEAYFYIIDQPNIKHEYETVIEEGGGKKTMDLVETTDDEEAHVDVDVDDSASIGLVEKIDNERSVASSVVALEEYLLEQSDAEDDPKCELDLKDDDKKHASVATIKVSTRHFSPHLRKRLGEVYIYVCDVCGNQFTNRSLMNYHMRIHRNEKNFECELCFKRFTAACNLTAHMRIHTGEKPFECKYCQRRFTDRSTHVKHERVHTNEKPFQCNICGKAFALSTTLRTHEKVHTGEKPFKCIPCNKSFKLPHQLKSHLNTNQHKSLKPEQDMRN